MNVLTNKRPARSSILNEESGRCIDVPKIETAEELSRGIRQAGIRQLEQSGQKKKSGSLKSTKPVQGDQDHQEYDKHNPGIKCEPDNDDVVRWSYSSSSGDTQNLAFRRNSVSHHQGGSDDCFPPMGNIDDAQNVHYRTNAHQQLMAGNHTTYNGSIYTERGVSSANDHSYQYTPTRRGNEGDGGSPTWSEHRNSQVLHNRRYSAGKGVRRQYSARSQSSSSDRKPPASMNKFPSFRSQVSMIHNESFDCSRASFSSSVHRHPPPEGSHHPGGRGGPGFHDDDYSIDPYNIEYGYRSHGHGEHSNGQPRGSGYHTAYRDQDERAERDQYRYDSPYGFSENRGSYRQRRESQGSWGPPQPPTRFANGMSPRSAYSPSSPTRRNSHDAAAETYEKTHESSVDRRSQPTMAQQQPLKVEICPGVFETLRGAKETWSAVQDGFVCFPNCMCCSSNLVCIYDAAFVLCPSCKVVNPLETTQGRGVGLGLLASCVEGRM